jgi:IS30 family transposase
MAHINREQRYTISVMLSQGQTQQAIASTIGKNKSVIFREIRRNRDQRSQVYHFELAQRKSENRQRDKPRQRRFTPAIQLYVEQGISSDLSPEQIAGVAKLTGVACVSHETIYQHVWADKRKKGTLYLHLRNKGRRYRKRGASKDTRSLIRNRVDISQRPLIVEQKTRVGDFELDTVIGRNHKGALVTTNDRRTGLVKIRKVASKDAKGVALATISLLYDFRDILHTITSDNGLEFAEHEMISDCLNIDFYFARPYHSWERGANENTNRLIRQYFPKKTDFDSITDKQVQKVEDILNNRPRKRLGYQSPLYTFNKLTKVAFVA